MTIGLPEMSGSPGIGPPLVSVVIPVFNGEAFIGAAVNSVLAQDHPRVELVLVDDGSSDRTPEILSAYGKRIRVITQANRGPASALNAGIAVTSGEFICWLGADDLFLPDKITTQVRLMQAGPDIGLIYTDYQVIDGTGRPLREVHCPAPAATLVRDLMLGNFINGSTVMVRRSVAADAGPYDEDLQADMDCDMWLRMARRCRFGHIPRIAVRYRWHDANVSHKLELMRANMDMVRQRALANTPPEELFPDHLGAKDGLAQELADLAGKLLRQGLILSARQAAGAASRRRFTLKALAIRLAARHSVAWAIILRRRYILPLRRRAD